MKTLQKSETLTNNQKCIKESFDLLNSQSILVNMSSKKYESFLQKIGRLADTHGEKLFFKNLVRVELMKSIG